MFRKLFFASLAVGAVTACTTAQPYGPADSAGQQGYLVQPIENNRFRVSYTALSPQEARQYALRRAAEVTLDNGAEWFRVTHSYTETERGGGGGGSSVSVGGSSGSYGSGVGVGVGVGLPLGGSKSKVTESLEILTGSGAKPQDVQVYDAQSVLANVES